MSDEHSGFIWDIEEPTRDGFVACLVITPKKSDATHSADVDAKVERNIGRGIALQIASELLQKCGVPDDLIQRVRVFR